MRALTRSVGAGMGQRPSRAWLALLWAVLVLIDAVAVFGASRLRYDDGIEVAFASEDERYEEHLRFKKQFTQADGDIAVLFGADDFADPKTLRRVQDFSLDAQLIPGVAGTSSIFALQDLGSSGEIGPVVPEPLPDQQSLERILTDLQARPSGLGRLISADRRLTGVVVTLENPEAQLPVIKSITRELEESAKAAAAGTDMTVEFTGTPVLRSTVISALFNDMWLFNVVGILASLVIGTYALRSFPLTLLVSLPPTNALLWTLGILGLAGFSINVLSAALPALIVVLSYADSLHLTFETERLRHGSTPGTHAPLQALRRVGPACVLASVTTAGAFAGLTFSSSTLMRDFGYAGIISALVSLAAVLITHVTVFTSASHWRFMRTILGAKEKSAPRLFDGSGFARFALKNARAVAIGSLMFLILAGVVYAQIQPVYTIYENIEHDAPTVTALEKLESQLIPSGVVDLPIPIPGHASPAIDATALRKIAAVHEAAARTIPEAIVVSAATLRSQVAPGNEDETVERVGALLNSMTPTQRRRFVSADGTHALVRIHVAEHDAAAGRALIAKLESALNAQAGTPEALRATGSLVVQSFVSRGMLLDLNTCFLIAVCFSGVLIALWFRRPVQGLVALVPNVLPILAVGAFLALSGWGLQYSSGVALTIAFGLAVDDTVHVLNRLRLTAPPGQPYQIEAIAQSVRDVTPALIITSAVLGFGLSGLFLSSLPTLRYFGAILIVIFILALVADLVVLPAWLKLLGSPSLSRRHWKHP